MSSPLTRISHRLAVLLVGLMTLGVSSDTLLAEATPSVPTPGAPDHLHNRVVYVPYGQLDRIFGKDRKGILVKYDQYQKLWQLAESRKPEPKQPGAPIKVSIEKAAVSAQDALKEGGKPEGLIGQAKAALQRLPVEVRAEVENGIKNLPQHVRNHFALISTSVLKFVGAIVGSLLRFVLVSFDFVLFFVIAGYLLIDWPTIQAKTQALLPRWHRADVLRIARAIDHDMRAFFRGQLLVALALGAIYTVGLLLCGVSFGLLIGVVAGLANIVPYLGIAVGLMPALLLSLIPYVGLLKPLGVLVSFSVAQMIEGFYLTPKIVGDNVGLSPVVVILSILVFAELFGFLGVIFAVPLASVCKVFLGELLAYYRRVQEPVADTPLAT